MAKHISTPLSLFISIIVFFLTLHTVFFRSVPYISISRNVHQQTLDGFVQKVNTYIRYADRQARIIHENMDNAAVSFDPDLEDEIKKNKYFLGLTVINDKGVQVYSHFSKKQLAIRDAADKGFAASKNLSSLFISIPASANFSKTHTLIFSYNFRDMLTDAWKELGHDVFDFHAVKMNLILNFSHSAESKDIFDQRIPYTDNPDGYVLMVRERIGVLFRGFENIPVKTILIFDADKYLGMPLLAFIVLSILLVQIFFLFILFYLQIVKQKTSHEIPTESEETALPYTAQTDDSSDVSFDESGDETRNESLDKPFDEDELFDFKINKKILHEPNTGMATTGDELPGIEEIPDSLYTEADVLPAKDNELKSLIEDVAGFAQPQKKFLMNKKTYIKAAQSILAHSEQFRFKSDNIRLCDNALMPLSAKKILVLSPDEAGCFARFQNKGFHEKTASHFKLPMASALVKKYLGKKKAVFLNRDINKSSFLHSVVDASELGAIECIILVPVVKNDILEMVICLTDIESL